MQVDSSIFYKRHKRHIRHCRIYRTIQIKINTLVQRISLWIGLHTNSTAAYSLYPTLVSKLLAFDFLSIKPYFINNGYHLHVTDYRECYIFVICCWFTEKWINYVAWKRFTHSERLDTDGCSPRSTISIKPY